MTGINTAPSESVNEEKICKVKSDYDNLLLCFYFQMKHDIWSNKQKQAKFFFKNQNVTHWTIPKVAIQTHRNISYIHIR